MGSENLRKESVYEVLAIIERNAVISLPESGTEGKVPILGEGKRLTGDDAPVLLHADHLGIFLRFAHHSRENANSLSKSETAMSCCNKRRLLKLTDACSIVVWQVCFPQREPQEDCVFSKRSDIKSERVVRQTFQVVILVINQNGRQTEKATPRSQWHP
jgi:hypothetical protein